MGKYRIVLVVVNAIFLLFALSSLAVAANSVRGWTPAQAAAKLKASYTTIDQQQYDFAKARGWADAMTAALHAAKVRAASCKGVGKATAGRYSRFYCTAKVAGTFRPPPDYVPYTATVKVTVRVPYRVLSGWR